MQPISYFWKCGAKSRSTPSLSTVMGTEEFWASIVDDMWSFSPKHSKDSPSESEEHCDDFDLSRNGKFN